MKIHCLTHVPFEDAAHIGNWAAANDYTLTYTRFYLDETLPPLESFDMLAIMGGLMNAYEHDTYPWLTAEKLFIRTAIDAKKKVVGICLGAQLIADVLGGTVTQNGHKEIGWHTIRKTPQSARCKTFAALPQIMTVFQWHGDTFTLPAGAIKLGSSGVCDNQAFAYDDHVLGLQFHLEYSQGSIEKMLINCSDELVDAPCIQTAEEIRNGYDNIGQTTAWLYTLLDAFTQSN